MISVTADEMRETDSVLIYACESREAKPYDSHGSLTAFLTVTEWYWFSLPERKISFLFYTYILILYLYCSYILINKTLVLCLFNLYLIKLFYEAILSKI